MKRINNGVVEKKPSFLQKQLINKLVQPLLDIFRLSFLVSLNGCCLTSLQFFEQDSEFTKLFETLIRDNLIGYRDSKISNYDLMCNINSYLEKLNAYIKEKEIK